jgi:hypothetical protein
LASIVGFAVLYSLFRWDFYHSTVTMEPGYAALRSELRAELTAALVDTTDSVRIPLDSDSVTVPGWLTIRDVRTGSDGQVHFTATAIVLSTRPGARYMRNAVFDVALTALDLPPERSPRKHGIEPQEMTYSLPFLVEQTGGPVLPGGTLEHLLRCRSSGVEGWSCIPMGLALKLDSFRLATSGHPAELGFWSAMPRMLYLSVVTINTLGYGDIVPLTGRARILTGLESMLGVVLLGAFASSLASRAASSARRTDMSTRDTGTP